MFHDGWLGGGIKLTPEGHGEFAISEKLYRADEGVDKRKFGFMDGPNQTRSKFADESVVVCPLNESASK